MAMNRYRVVTWLVVLCAVGLLSPVQAQKKNWGGAVKNIALGKPCTTSSRSQWSTNEQGAVDGIKNGTFGFHTAPGPAWWQVDLGTVYKLDNAIIYNRTDCCSERARTLQVLLSDDGNAFRTVFTNDGTVFGGVNQGQPLAVDLSGAKARYVRLMITSGDALHLDEVEIYGTEAGIKGRLGMDKVDAGTKAEVKSDWTAGGGYSSQAQSGTYTSWNNNWKLPAPGKGAILFKVTARNDVHIALSDAAQTMDPMYEIVLGGWGNTKCAVRRRSQGPSIAEVAGTVRKPGVEDTYWAMIDPDKGIVSAGNGVVPGQNLIIECKDPNLLRNVQYFAFSSWDTPIEYSDVRAVPIAMEKKTLTGTYVRTLKDVYLMTEKVVVEYHDFPTGAGAWITIIPKNQADDQWGNYQSTTGASGELEFAPSGWGFTPGDYEVRGYSSSSDYTVKARYSFTISGGQ